MELPETLNKTIAIREDGRPDPRGDDVIDAEFRVITLSASVCRNCREPILKEAKYCKRCGHSNGFPRPFEGYVIDEILT